MLTSRDNYTPISLVRLMLNRSWSLSSLMHAARDRVLTPLALKHAQYHCDGGAPPAFRGSG